MKPFNTDGVVTYVSRNDSAYTSVYLLEDATGVMEVIPSKKLPMPSVNDRIKVFGLPNCPPPGANSGPIFSEAFRNPGKMAPDTASKLVSSRAAMMKDGGALQH